VHGHPLAFSQWAAFYDSGIPVVISDVRQVPAACWPPQLKCRSRMHFYLADRAAAAKRPGARAILLDDAGFVAESTTANVLAYRADEGLVSPTSENILWGVTLSVIQELAGGLGLPFKSRRLTVEELRSADEVMLASTSVCVLPVVECDGRPVGSGAPGPLYRRMLTAWSELAGLDIAEQARRYAARPAI
jgi:branched-subunit amino acid aminotransferase/4-amino-4-deoxychorismate lyase